MKGGVIRSDTGLCPSSRVGNQPLPPASLRSDIFKSNSYCSLHRLFRDGRINVGMRRRAFLTGLTGSLPVVTGCLSTAPAGVGGSFEERTVSLTHINETPDDHNLAISVDVVEPSITDEHTAGVRVSIENTGPDESPGIGISEEGLDQLGPVGPNYGHDVPNEILLVPAALEQPAPRDGCWTTEEAGGPWNGGVALPDMTLEPGASFTQDYRVWDPQPESPCMPVGEYRFGKRVSQVEDPRPGWMFTLSIETPT